MRWVFGAHNLSITDDFNFAFSISGDKSVVAKCQATELGYGFLEKRIRIWSFFCGVGTREWTVVEDMLPSTDKAEDRRMDASRERRMP